MSPEDIGYVWMYDEGLFLHKGGRELIILKPSNIGLFYKDRPNQVEKDGTLYKSKLDNQDQTDVQIFPKEFFVCV
jgi:hypothetical protein